jgi:hypothetical protein
MKPKSRASTAIRRQKSWRSSLLSAQLDHDGLVSIKLMLTGRSGEGFSVEGRRICRCDPVVAVRLVERRQWDPATRKRAKP